MGHPAGSMDIGTERYFQIQGQDIVWRYVEPGEKAIEGQHSTLAKCASSSMLHLGYRRNSNELYGAYGHDLTYEEMVWLAEWCFVRGQNLLIPHAFYYSIRGPRFEERPPDVGPHSAWWEKYKPFADACRRLSWINTDSRHICDIAILTDATWLPDKPAKVLYQNQRDFNYLEIRHIWEDAKITSKGVEIAGMTYSAIIIDSLTTLPSRARSALRRLAQNNRLIIRDVSGFSSMFTGALVYKTEDDLIAAVNKITIPDLKLSSPSKNIRYRHVEKDGDHYYLLFNEERSEVLTGIRHQASGVRQWIDLFTAEGIASSTEEIVHFKPYELKILRVSKP